MNPVGGRTGGHATVSVTVICVDDDAVAVDDSRTVDEDSGATSFDVLGNDSDQENDPIEITGVPDPGPANGTATVVEGSPDEISYTPDADYCNDPGAAAEDTFTYTITGGSTATVSVTVTCKDDPDPDPEPQPNPDPDPRPDPVCKDLTVTRVVVAGEGPVTGTPGRDVILGSAGPDHIDGGAGNDVICANGGNDRVTGGTGNDRLSGNDGR